MIAQYFGSAIIGAVMGFLFYALALGFTDHEPPHMLWQMGGTMFFGACIAMIILKNEREKDANNRF